MKNITVKTILSNILEIMAGGFILICTGLVLVNVFLRYFMHTGLYWSEEVCTSCFVWAVYIGAAACYKRGMHLGVDVLVNKLPGGARRVVKLVVDALLVVLNAYITYVAYIYVSLSYKKPTAVLNVSTAYISSSLVISFACMTVFSVLFLAKDLMGKNKSE